MVCQDKEQKGYCCPITGFSLCCNATFWKSMILMVIWFLGFEWFWHTQVMAESYHATAHLWRAEAEIKQHCYWLWGGIALMGAMAAAIFTHGYKHCSCREGIRYGIIMTLFMWGNIFIGYAVHPVSMKLIHLWMAGTAIQFIFGGVLMAWIHGCCCSKPQAHGDIAKEAHCHTSHK